MTPKELVTKYCYNLPAMQRKANEQYFTKVAAMVANGGTYVWPDMAKVFTVRDGKFFEV